MWIMRKGVITLRSLLSAQCGNVAPLPQLTQGIKWKGENEAPAIEVNAILMTYTVNTLFNRACNVSVPAVDPEVMAEWSYWWRGNCSAAINSHQPQLLIFMRRRSCLKGFFFPHAPAPFTHTSIWSLARSFLLIILIYIGSFFIIYLTTNTKEINKQYLRP